MTEATKIQVNPLIIMADKIAPKPYLTSFVRFLSKENQSLATELTLKYAVCKESAEVSVTLRKYKEAVKMILLGPGLIGNPVTVARMLSSRAHIILVVDPTANPLGSDLATLTRTRQNLIDLGIIIVEMEEATEGFFKPIIQERVLSGLSPDSDLEVMTPEERASLLDKRLESVSSFPSLPETQRKVAALDDMDSPKKWAEAIDPDLPTRSVILRMLNSARYGFRSRVETIEKAVAMASSKTIREIVIACQMHQLFQKTPEKSLDQYWRHSLGVAFYAKLLALPADPDEQNGQSKSEFERYQLDEEQVEVLQGAEIWKSFEVGDQIDVFTAGLLHDIGKITMALCLEDSLSLVRSLIEAEVEEAGEGLWARSALDIEQFLMKDMDHQLIGDRIAVSWELEDYLRQAISSHHDIKEESHDMVKLIALGNLAASTLFPYPATDEQHPFPVLFKRLEQAIGQKAGKSLAEATKEAIEETILEDLEGALKGLEIPEILWEHVEIVEFFQACYMLAPKIRTIVLGFLQQTKS